MGFLKEDDNEEDVLFLYKLSPGSASNSFGINVAKMAELPESIVKQAREISDLFEIVCEVNADEKI